VFLHLIDHDEIWYANQISIVNEAVPMLHWIPHGITLLHGMLLTVEKISYLFILIAQSWIKTPPSHQSKSNHILQNLRTECNVI